MGIWMCAAPKPRISEGHLFQPRSLLIERKQISQIGVIAGILQKPMGTNGNQSSPWQAGARYSYGSEYLYTSPVQRYAQRFLQNVLDYAVALDDEALLASLKLD